MTITTPFQHNNPMKQLTLLMPLSLPFSLPMTLPMTVESSPNYPFQTPIFLPLPPRQGDRASVKLAITYNAMWRALALTVMLLNHSLYYSVRSILPKLRANVFSQKPDIVCTVETWLSEDVTDNACMRFCYMITRCTDWIVIGMAVALLCICT